jgi:hypothetical protein
MAKSSPESNSDFQSVSSIGAGYLAVTWLFTKLILMQSDPRRTYILGSFGMLLQLAFASIFEAQRNARYKQLNMPQSRWPLRKDDGDVVLRMLNCLVAVFLGWIAVFGLITFIASFPNVKVHPFTF